MLGYEDLYNCDTSVFTKDAAKWQGLAGALANHGNDLRAAMNGLGSWIGDAADAAKRSSEPIGSSLRRWPRRSARSHPS